MWNDRETDVDLLGHEKIAQTIVEIIDDPSLRPLTVGVYGDWGAGKSSVLSILSKKLEEANAEGRTRNHVIKFNGWLFQGFEDTRTALMETIVSELVSKLKPTDKIKRLAQSLFHRIEWLSVAKLGGKLALAAAGGAGGGLASLAFLAGGSVAKEAPNSGGNERVEVNVEKENETSLLRPASQTIAQHINAFREEFRTLVELGDVDSVVVLVDDLDRCLPSAVIEILEAIRLFLFVDGTVFVISADEQMIEYAVQQHFPDLPNHLALYPRQYLEKLIQIPIRIPAQNQLQTTNYIKFLVLQAHFGNETDSVRELYASLEATRKTPYQPVELSYDFVIGKLGSESEELRMTLQIADQLGRFLSRNLRGNPRNTKRFLNTLFLRIRIAKIYGLSENVLLGVLGKLMLLENFHPELYDQLVSRVIASPDGMLGDQDIAIVGKDDPAQGANEERPIDEATERFEEWRVQEPSLAGVDLRPYIFVSREKVIGAGAIDGASERLSEIAAHLRSSSIILRNGATKLLQTVTDVEVTKLFAMFESELRSVQDLRKMPGAVHGLIAITKVNPAKSDAVLLLLESLPTRNLGPWVAAELSGGLTSGSSEKVRKLLTAWAERAENPELKSAAKAILQATKSRS
ncbi:MAG: hypothetical protein JSS75_04070 [Bacteroidetes bacterium]|nr:hypothetical protein [Bacteroidota bacterium]